MTALTVAPTPIARHASARPATTEKGIWGYLGTAVSAAVLVLVLALAVLAVGLPAVTGGRAFTVLTQSMEPHLPPGTLLVIRPAAAADVRVGDVLTYQIESGRPDVVSHRVISRVVADDGSVTFLTQGDNNSAADPDPVQEVQIVGTLWYSIPLLGWVNTLVSGELRGIAMPVIVGALFVYAGVQALSAVLARRRSRRT